MKTAATHEDISNAFYQVGGVLYWKNPPKNKSRFKGKVAGNLHKLTGYMRVRFMQNTYQAHRVVWVLEHGEWPKKFIDHINGIKSDNRIENLRDVSSSENSQNRRGPKKTNSSGLMGITLHKQIEKWQAQIIVSGRMKYLGLYSSKEEAHQVYINAKREFHAGCTI